MKKLNLLLKITLIILVLGINNFVFAKKETTIIVMLGDSTTLCAGSKPGHKLTDYVKSDLTKIKNLRVSVINSGKGGDTVKGGYNRLEKNVFSHNPDIITISFGLNDTGKLTPDEFRKWLIKIVKIINKETKAKILLVTSTPFNNKRHGWRKRFVSKGGLDEYMDNNICSQMRDVAKKFKLPICDLHTYFKAEFKKKPGLIKTLIRGDGVHLTTEGNKAAAKYLVSAIHSLITKK